MKAPRKRLLRPGHDDADSSDRVETLSEVLSALLQPPTTLAAMRKPALPALSDRFVPIKLANKRIGGVREGQYVDGEDADDDNDGAVETAGFLAGAPVCTHTPY